MNFTNEEYKSRLKKVQASMQKKGIELLISQDPSNMNYLTGYDAWSFYYAQCVIVHVNADEPICFVRNQDAGGAYIKTYLKDFDSKIDKLKNELKNIYGKEYYNERPFKRHQQRKSCRGLKMSRKCDQCNKEFSKPSNLRAHIKHYHEKIRPFKCLTCEKGFIDKRNLNAHHQKQHPELFIQIPEVRKMDIYS